MGYDIVGWDMICRKDAVPDNFAQKGPVNLCANYRIHSFRQ